MIRITWWRGALVALAWLVWPVAAFLLDVVVRFLTSQSRGCSIEGCSFGPTAAELALYFVPPLLGTAWWWRWRRNLSR